MVVFDLYEIAKRFNVSPDELRKIADRLEKEGKITISEKEKIYQGYRQKLVNQKKKK